MAELRDLRFGVDITRGVTRGLDIVQGIKRLKQADITETRTAEAFEIEKTAARQRLETDIQVEKDRRKKAKIDELEGLYDIAMFAGDLAEADSIKEDIAVLWGRQIDVDNEAFHKLIMESRKAKKEGDTERVKAIGDYMFMKSTSIEEVSRRLKITSEVEALGAERKLEEAVTAKKVEFELEKTQIKEIQATISEALKGVEDITESDATLISLAGSGQIPANILPTLLKTKDVKFIAGRAGTGVNAGKIVTKAIDGRGKPVLDEEGVPIEFVKGEPERRGKSSLQIEENPLTGEKKAVVFVEILDAKSNIVGVKKLAGIQSEEEIAKVTAIEEVDIKENFSFEEYKATVINLADVTEEELITGYLASVNEGLLKRPTGEPPTVEKVKKKGEDKSILSKISDIFKTPEKEAKKEPEKTAQQTPEGRAIDKANLEEALKPFKGVGKTAIKTLKIILTDFFKREETKK